MGVSERPGRQQCSGCGRSSHLSAGQNAWVLVEHMDNAATGGTQFLLKGGLTSVDEVLSVAGQVDSAAAAAASMGAAGIYTGARAACQPGRPATPLRHLPGAGAAAGPQPGTAWTALVFIEENRHN